MSAKIAERGSSLLIGKVQALFQADPIPSLIREYDIAGAGQGFAVAGVRAQQPAEPQALQ